MTSEGACRPQVGLASTCRRGMMQAFSVVFYGDGLARMRRPDRAPVASPGRQPKQTK